MITAFLPAHKFICGGHVWLNYHKIFIDTIGHTSDGFVCILLNLYTPLCTAPFPQHMLCEQTVIIFQGEGEVTQGQSLRDIPRKTLSNPISPWKITIIFKSLRMG